MKRNIRFVADNATDRMTVIASSAAGALTPDRLLTGKKSDVWRALDLAPSLVIGLAQPESVSLFALAHCNLTAAAQIRVRAYADPTGQVMVHDTGFVDACPAPSVRLKGWPGAAALSANSWAFGGGACARVWFPEVVAARLVIDIADPSNGAGFVEASCLVVGAYFSAEYNFGYGAGVTLQDRSQQYLTASGDQGVDADVRNSNVKFDLSRMTPGDRTAVLNLFLSNGLTYPIFLSLLPESDDLVAERAHQVYGRLTSISQITIASYNTYSAPIEVQSV